MTLTLSTQPTALVLDPSNAIDAFLIELHAAAQEEEANSAAHISITPSDSDSSRGEGLPHGSHYMHGRRRVTAEQPNTSSNNLDALVPGGNTEPPEQDPTAYQPIRRRRSHNHRQNPYA